MLKGDLTGLPPTYPPDSMAKRLAPLWAAMLPSDSYTENTCSGMTLLRGDSLRAKRPQLELTSSRVFSGCTIGSAFIRGSVGSWCKRKEQGLIGLLWAHEIRSDHGFQSTRAGCDGSKASSENQTASPRHTLAHAGQTRSWQAPFTQS
jgi:hypothetical protein